MSIITKPSVTKGTLAQFTLNKSELLLNSVVAADSYFSDSQNWNKVQLVYKSSIGGQYEIVEFDATQTTPTGNFLVSTKARDSFEISRLKIIDFDGGVLEVPRSSLTSTDFDIAVGGSVAPSFLSINSEEITTSETGGWTFYNGNYYNLNDGATRIVQRIATGQVRALGVTLSDGNPTTDGMEWVPISVTISGGNSSSSFTPIKTFSFVRSDFTADVLKYLVLDSDQAFEFYRITFNSYDKTYGGSLFIQGQVSLHTTAGISYVTWDVGISGYTLGSQGAISRNLSSTGGGWDWAALVKSSNSSFSGNFEVEYTFNGSSILEGSFFGVSTNASNIDNGAYIFGALNISNTYYFYFYGNQSTTISNIVSGLNTIKVIKSGSTISLVVNGVTIGTSTNSSTNYPAVRLGGSVLTSKSTFSIV